VTRVVAPSRLHFGLLHMPTGGLTHATGSPARLFGGCGLMIDAPGVAVAVEPASDWHGEGPLSSRAVEFARMVTNVPHRVVVERCPPEHVGLGTGTALGLAVAKAIRPELTAPELAQFVGRGRRSGVGLHGFEHGGFIVDHGKTDEGSLPGLACRLAFPEDWHVAVIIPDQPTNWHGLNERTAFARRRDSEKQSHTAARMEELLHGEIVPALDAAAFDRFCEGLHEYNRLAGVAFEAEQGGLYASPIVAEIVDVVRGLGFPGVGQSSWGPCVFAVAPNERRAEDLTDVVRGRFPALKSVGVTTAARTGAVASLS
jgi:beta-ribofuranosylaminobenzene 5'-phosphate synthase